jgi:hypothetical protein
MLVHLGGKHDAFTVRERVGTAMAALPAHLRKIAASVETGSALNFYLEREVTPHISPFDWDLSDANCGAIEGFIAEL